MHTRLRLRAPLAPGQPRDNTDCNGSERSHDHRPGEEHLWSRRLELVDETEVSTLFGLVCDSLPAGRLEKSDGFGALLGRDIVLVTLGSQTLRRQCRIVLDTSARHEPEYRPERGRLQAVGLAMVARRKYPSRPRCRVCLVAVGVDGLCLYRCDPALARPGLRTVAAAVKTEPLLKISRQERERTRDVMREVDVFFRLESDAARKRRS